MKNLLHNKLGWVFETYNVKDNCFCAMCHSVVLDSSGGMFHYYKRPDGVIS